MSVLSAAFKVSRASLPSRNSRLPSYAASINNGAASYVVEIVTRHMFEPGVGIRVI
jgi:hypothetical protein